MVEETAASPLGQPYPLCHGSLRDCGDGEGRPDTGESAHLLLLVSRKSPSVLKGQFAVRKSK